MGLQFICALVSPLWHQLVPMKRWTNWAPQWKQRGDEKKGWEKRILEHLVTHMYPIDSARIQNHSGRLNWSSDWLRPISGPTIARAASTATMVKIFEIIDLISKENTVITFVFACQTMAGVEYFVSLHWEMFDANFRNFAEGLRAKMAAAADGKF